MQCPYNNRNELSPENKFSWRHCTDSKAFHIPCGGGAWNANQQTRRRIQGLNRLYDDEFDICCMNMKILCIQRIAGGTDYT
jgi:hypothetical protein